MFSRLLRKLERSQRPSKLKWLLIGLALVILCLFGYTYANAKEGLYKVSGRTSRDDVMLHTNKIEQTQQAVLEVDEAKKSMFVH